jgi:hypothetical protein
MFQRIQQYEPVEMGGRWYRPRAYGDPQPDGRWDGWLVFFPVRGGAAVASASPDTTQSTLGALADWSLGLTPVYLDGALARALRVSQRPSVLARLSEAEEEALADAEQLEVAAGVERTAADLDEAAARVARAEAEEFRRERLATEAALAATEEAAAEIEAAVDEAAARVARAEAEEFRRERLVTEAKLAATLEGAADIAAGAGEHAAREAGAVEADGPRRRRSAQEKARPRTPGKPRRKKK